MTNILLDLKRLSVGVSNLDFPIYCQFLTSQNGKLITYNDDVERGLSVYTTVSEEHWGEIEEEVETTKEESNG